MADVPDKVLKWATELVFLVSWTLKLWCDCTSEPRDG